MTWIATVAFEDATGKVRQLYERIKGPDNNVDNIMMAHSLRPHTMEGHMALYKNVIHHPRNTLPKWLLEAVGVYVSLINKCDYCIEHHYAGMRRLLNDDERSSEIRTALEAEDPEWVTGAISNPRPTRNSSSVSVTYVPLMATDERTHSRHQFPARP